MTAKPAAFDPRHVSLLWAVHEHAADIARLHATLFEKGWDEASITGMLAHPGSVALLAGAGNPRLVGGFALAQVAADEAEILTLGVRAEWQRHGVGVKLIEGVKRAAQRAGARQVFLEVAASNAAALALYAKTGFAEAGRRKGYYAKTDGANEDAVMLRAALVEGKG